MNQLIRYSARVLAINPSGRSQTTNIKATTIKMSSRLPLMPAEESKCSSGVIIFYEIFFKGAILSQNSLNA